MDTVDAIDTSIPSRGPLHQVHERLAAKFGPFNGWSMPIEYSGVGTLAEYRAVRQRVGIFDVSHMGTLRVTGSGAVSFVDSILTNAVAAAAPGTAQYNLLCDRQGGVIDDLIVYRGRDEVVLVPNAGNIAAVFDVLAAGAAGSAAGVAGAAGGGSAAGVAGAAGGGSAAGVAGAAGGGSVGFELADPATAADLASVTGAGEGAPAGAVVIENISDQCAIIAIQGPRSTAVLEACGLDPRLAYMRFVEIPGLPGPPGPPGPASSNPASSSAVADSAEAAAVGGSVEHTETVGRKKAAVGAGLTGGRVLLSRTGYTGEVGYELIVPVAQAPDWWERLQGAVSAEGGVAAGLGARDILRTEMAYPLYGHELSRQISPAQAGLNWAVAWGKPRFEGREALLAEREGGSDRRIRALRCAGRGIPRAGMAVDTAFGEGLVSSGTFSPGLSRGIALALLPVGVQVGDEVAIDIRGRRCEATVVKPPFVDADPRGGTATRI